jgi:phenylacetate-CoA ligase
MGFDDEEFLNELGTGALLHDVGKSKISDRILNKRSALNQIEFEIMKKHPQWGVEMLESYPSSAFALARFLESRNEHLPLRAVMTTGEPLLSVEREVIEERFQTRAYDSYGQAERVAFSSECEEHNGHHIFPEYAITEVVDEAGEALPAGRFGELVGTGLHNYAMPLIRYACGDAAVLSDRSCPCGRTLPIIEGVVSRVGDLIVTPDGRTLPPIMITWVVRWIDGVTQYQVRQESLDRFTLLVVTPEPITDEQRRRVSNHFEWRIAPGVRVTVERVDDIPGTGRGKKRLVISEVPLPWGGGNRLSGLSEADAGKLGES